jgi:hypothetical protein
MFMPTSLLMARGAALLDAYGQTFESIRLHAMFTSASAQQRHPDDRRHRRRGQRVQPRYGHLWPGGRSEEDCSLLVQQADVTLVPYLTRSRHRLRRANKLDILLVSIVIYPGML